MRIKSNLPNNMSHSIAGKRITFPARAVLELDDKQYEGHVPFIEAHVKSGNLEFLKKPAVSVEVQAKIDAKALADAKALIAAADKAAADKAAAAKAAAAKV